MAALTALLRRRLGLATKSQPLANELCDAVDSMTTNAGTFTGNKTFANYFFESAGDTITAFAGGGQTSATALTKQTNRITTVTTAADSVKLPASVAGLELVVINHGANPMQVFGAGTDKINDVATGTGVSQLPNSTVIYSCVTAGDWYTEGLATGFSSGLQTLSFTNAVTAFAGGGQGSATALTALINRIATVTTAADSVKLPVSAAGMEVIIINAGANPAQVFGAGTDTINGVATGTGVSQMQSSVVVYVCTAAGTWLAEGLGQGYSGSLATASAVNSLTAFAGGGQGSATALTAMLNRVTTVATAADSVKLPTSAVGMVVTAINAAALSMNVFPATGDAINAIAANSAFAQGGLSSCTYYCTVAGTWHTIYSPSLSTGSGSAVLATAPTITTATLTDPIVTNATRCSGSVTANGTTTYANVTGLVQTVVAGTYKFRCVLPSTVASGTGGIKYAFHYVTTSLTSIEATGLGFTASAVAVQHTTTATDVADLFTQAAVVIMTLLEGTMVVATGGTVQLQMAQNTSNGSNTITLVGASMEFTRIS